MDAARRMELVYPVPETDPRWQLEDDVTLPISGLQDAILLLLVQVLIEWGHRDGRNVYVARNRALRWDRHHPKHAALSEIARLRAEIEQLRQRGV